VSALNLGTKLVAVLLGIATSGVGTVVLPHFSLLAARGDWNLLRHAIRSQGKLILLAATAGTFVLIAASDWLIALLFRSAAFTDDSARLVGQVQRAALIRIPFSILMTLGLGMISALRRNELFLRVALAALAVNAALDILLVEWIGITGIPLAGSIAQAVAAVYLGFLIRKAIRARLPA
jgi:putative peptidoglycan lipid II flippase